MKKLTRIAACILIVALLCGLTASLASAKETVTITVKTSSQNTTYKVEGSGLFLVRVVDEDGKMTALKLLDKPTRTTTVDVSSKQGTAKVFWLDATTLAPMELQASEDVDFEADEIGVIC